MEVCRTNLQGKGLAPWGVPQPARATAAPTTIWDVLDDGKPHSLPELVQATGLTEDAVRELLQPAIDDLRVQSIYDGRRARRTGGRGERKYRATP